jgi:hypothetical protein
MDFLLDFGTVSCCALETKAEIGARLPATNAPTTRPSPHLKDAANELFNVGHAPPQRPRHFQKKLLAKSQMLDTLDHNGPAFLEMPGTWRPSDGAHLGQNNQQARPIAGRLAGQYLRQGSGSFASIICPKCMERGGEATALDDIAPYSLPIGIANPGVTGIQDWRAPVRRIQRWQRTE